MEVRKNRSDTYVCSIDPLCISDMNQVLFAIKQTVKAQNASVRDNMKRALRSNYFASHAHNALLKRVSIKGREAKEKQFINVNGWRSVPDNRLRSYDMFGDIVGNKYTNSKRLDVYIHDDYTATESFKNRLLNQVKGEV